MFNIVICDNQKYERDAQSDILCEYFSGSDIEYKAYEYDSGKKLLDDYIDGLARFDLLLMDIFMDDMNGFDAAKAIRQIDRRVPIAFLTNSKDFAIESYEVEAVGYLVKPVNTERLHLILNKLTRAEVSKSLALKQKGRLRYYEYRDIVSAESHGHVVTIHLADGHEETSYCKLDDLELDDPRFIRCHKSYLVNMDYVKYAEDDFLMNDGSRVPIRAHGKKEIIDMYTNYFVKKHLGETPL